VATPIRVVVAAIQESSVQVSYVGVRPWRWSVIKTKSNPSSSADLASRTGSAPAAADVETFSPNTTFIAFPIARAPAP
jgi:hypothetical protein